MLRSRPLPGLWCLALLALVTSAPAASQDGPPPRPDSEIGRLLLTLQTTDGRPVVGTNVVVRTRAGGSEPGGTLRTDENGNASVPGDAFPEGADVTIGVQVRYGSSSLDGAFPLVDTGDLYFANTDDVHMRIQELILTDAPEGACSGLPRDGIEIGDLFGGCGTSEDIQWAGGVDLPLRVEVDASCGAVAEGHRDGWRGSDIVSARLLSPAGSEGDPNRELLGLDERDVDWDYDAYYARTTLDAAGRLSPECANPPPATERESEIQTAVFALLGYNLDFEDGALGVRATAPLPIFRGRNLGGAVGLDIYLQDDTRTLFAVNADVTRSFPWPALGDATAFAGVGPRALFQFFDGAGGAPSSSSTEFGVGAVSGMTYGVGPVSLYGDVGFDYIFDTFVPVTHVGVGVAFSGD